jgi:beta-glucanase (GH16 family)
VANSPLLGEWTSSFAGSKLDLSSLRLSFEDNFNTLSVAGPNGSPTTASWFAPVHSNFGSAAFQAPTAAVNPFSVSDGALTIEMAQVGGQWQTGYMQSLNASGQGFSQRYGYFEMSAKFPAGQGSWPAFWLLSADPTKPRVEIDIVEAYGGNDFDGHHAAVHLTPVAGSDLTAKADSTDYTNIKGSMFDGQFHTYGAMLTPQWLVIYYDGTEITRLAASKYFDTPLYMCVDLAMYQGEAAQASGKYDMVIDYVRAYGGLSGPLSQTTDPAGGLLQGQATDDSLSGGVGNDTLMGGAGNDTLTDVAGSNVLRGEDGADSITGGSGFDDINGNAGNDTISGGLGNDWVVGGKDQDLLNGDGGNDIVYGNLGADTCFGGTGDDTIRGGQGDDSLSGGAGNDWISGDLGSDTETGGSGADTFHSAAGYGVDRITDFNLAEGDHVELDAGTAYSVAQVGADTVISMSGAQVILAGVQLSSLSAGWITVG